CRWFGKLPRAGAADPPCTVPAWTRETRDEPVANRIANVNHDDGDRLGGVLGCRRYLRPRRCDDEVHLEPDQLGRQVGQPVDPILRISIDDNNILALNPPELAQPLPERVEQRRPCERGRPPKNPFPRHLSRLLLRTRRLRPCRHAAEKRDELAAPHVGHRLPSRLRPRSVYRRLNLLQRGRQVLGVDLNCSESRWSAAEASSPRAPGERRTAAFQSPLCPLWVIRVGRSRQRTRPMSALLQKRTITRSSR